MHDPARMHRHGLESSRRLVSGANHPQRITCVPHSLGNGVTGDKAVSEDGSSFGCDKAMIRVVTEHAEAAAAMFWTALETAASKSRLDFGDMIAQCRKGCEPGRGGGGVRGGRPDNIKVTVPDDIFGGAARLAADCSATTAFIAWFLQRWRGVK